MAYSFIRSIPLCDIDDRALVRDRIALDPDSLIELRHSIALNGLRLPIEVYERSEHDDSHRYGLISGYRRLMAFRAQFENTGQQKYAEIPAFLRTPTNLADAMVAMVEENDIRADISPWERGHVALKARDMGIFGTIEEAVSTLYPTATTVKRSRIRAVARLAEEMDGLLSAPETLSQAQALRLAAAIREGYGPLIRATLTELAQNDPGSQWQALLPILRESERPDSNAAPPPKPLRPGRPRRISSPRTGLTIRREATARGYSLHFSGQKATSALLDTVFDEIDRLFSQT